MGTTAHSLSEHQRQAEGGLQYHFPASVLIRRLEKIKSLAHPSVTFCQQRHLQPKRSRRGSQVHGDGQVARWRKGPIKPGSNIVDLGRPCGGGVFSSRIGPSRHEQISVIVRMTAADHVSLATLREQRKSKGSRGFR